MWPTYERAVIHDLYHVCLPKRLLLSIIRCSLPSAVQNRSQNGKRWMHGGCSMTRAALIIQRLPLWSPNGVGFFFSFFLEVVPAVTRAATQTVNHYYNFFGPLLILLNVFEVLVLSVYCFLSYGMLTPLMSPKDRKCILIDWTKETKNTWWVDPPFSRLVLLGPLLSQSQEGEGKADKAVAAHIGTHVQTEARRQSWSLSLPVLWLFISVKCYPHGRLISRFRCGCHTLLVDTGLFGRDNERCSREDKVCLVCMSGSVEFTTIRFSWIRYNSGLVIRISLHAARPCRGIPMCLINHRWVYLDG